jgi:hypothetical protein
MLLPIPVNSYTLTLAEEENNGKVDYENCSTDSNIIARSRSLERLTYRAMFFAVIMPAAPKVIQAEKGRPIAFPTNCQSDKIIHQAPPSKFQPLAVLANPNPSPVNTLMAVVAD